MALGTVVVVAGCGRAHTTVAGPLLSDPGRSGYVLDRAASQQRQSIPSFAQSTPADPALLRTELERLKAKATASRVWTQPDGEFVLNEAVRFDTAAHAVAFTGWYRAQMHERAAGVFPLPELDRGYAFVTGGNGRTSATTDVFVEGVLFVAGAQVFLVETGGPNPASLVEAEALARRESALAAAPTQESR